MTCLKCEGLREAAEIARLEPVDDENTPWNSGFWCAIECVTRSILARAAECKCESVAVPRVVLEQLQWDDDLDETACPTGSVTCRICDGGGGQYGKHTRHITPTHKENCPIGVALAAAKGER